MAAVFIRNVPFHPKSFAPTSGFGLHFNSWLSWCIDVIPVMNVDVA
jgi:hypothetical protein